MANRRTSSLISGYVEAPKIPFEGYDTETGIRTLPESAGRNAGHEYLRVRFNRSTVAGELSQDEVKIFPADGKKFTESEREALKPENGYNFTLTSDPRTQDRHPKPDGSGRYPAFARLHSDGAFPAIENNSQASRKSFDRIHDQQKKEFGQKMAAEEAEKHQKQADWIHSLEPKSFTGIVKGEPETKYDDRTGQIMTSIPVVPDENSGISVDQLNKQGTVYVMALYKLNLQEADELSFTNVGANVSKAGNLNFYSLDENSVALTKRNDPSRNPDERAVSGAVKQVYASKDGGYDVYTSTQEHTEVAGEDMVKKSDLVIVHVSDQTGKALEAEMAKRGEDGADITLQGTGTLSLEKGLDRKAHKHLVRTHVNMTDEDGKDNASLLLDGKKPAELGKAKPKTRKRAPEKTNTETRTQNTGR